MAEDDVMPPLHSSLYLWQRDSKVKLESQILSISSAISSDRRGSRGRGWKLVPRTDSDYLVINFGKKLLGERLLKNFRRDVKLKRLLLLRPSK